MNRFALNITETRYLSMCSYFCQQNTVCLAIESSSTVEEIQEAPPEILHLILTGLGAHSQFAVTQETKDTFLSKIRERKNSSGVIVLFTTQVVMLVLF